MGKEEQELFTEKKFTDEELATIVEAINEIEFNKERTAYLKKNYDVSYRTIQRKLFKIGYILENHKFVKVTENSQIEGQISVLEDVEEINTVANESKQVEPAIEATEPKQIQQAEDHKENEIDEETDKKIEERLKAMEELNESLQNDRMKAKLLQVHHVEEVKPQLKQIEDEKNIKTQKGKSGRPKMYARDENGKNLDKKKLTLEIAPDVYKALKRYQVEEEFKINNYIEQLLRENIPGEYFK